MVSAHLESPFCNEFGLAKPLYHVISVPAVVNKSRRDFTILFISLCLLIAFAFGDSFYGHFMLGNLAKVRTMEEPPGSFPIASGSYQQNTILPPASMDMRWWILHAQSMLESGSVRVRETQIDNAPEGREVHWSSGLIWLIVGMAKLISIFNGQPAADCVVAAAILAPLVLLALSVAGIGAIVAKRLGWGVAGLFVLVLFTSRTVYEGFVYGMADHHGMVFAFATASVLALALAGAGLVNSRKTKFPFLLEESSARRWMILSGILGGAALWVSAATAIPVLAGCGAGAIASAWMGRRAGIPLQPSLWRSWGRAGCMASLCFYALEYFPSHMGWRLEVNHPLHALAWLAATELLARILSRLFHGGRFTDGSPRDILILLLAFGLVLVPPVMALSRPDLFFIVSDKFLLALHKEYINEFQPFWIFLFSDDGALFQILTVLVWPFVVVLAIPLLLWREGFSPVWRCVVFFVLGPLLPMQALAFAQVRWQGMATGLWMVAVLILFAAACQARSVARLPRFPTAILIALAMLAAVWHPQGVLRNAFSTSDNQTDLPKNCAPTILMRDVAHRLLQSSPNKIPVVLAGPNSSTELSYYGHIHTLGTLYWENVEGLKKAARIFAAPDAQAALDLVQKTGVTHIVVASWDDFGMDYVRLLKKSNGIPSSSTDEPFVKSLLDGAAPPDWLRPLYYPIPHDFGLQGERVRIFAVVPDQTPVQALIHRGIYQLDAGDAEAAKKMFTRVLELSPNDPRAREGLKAAEALPAEH